VPGLYGSELQHWQTWIEHKIPNAIRVEQEDWDNPILTIWGQRLLEKIDQTPGEIWIIAHSFGCLVTVYAASQRAERIAGAMLVAPANPAFFNANGFQKSHPYIAAANNIALRLPQHYLGFPSVIVASNTDPWFSLEDAYAWAERWDSHLINIGDAGHINVSAGFGAWPQGLEIFQRFQQSNPFLPVGIIPNFSDTLSHKIAR
jgi:hypothetical protein